MKSILTTTVLVMALSVSAFSNAPKGTYVPSKVQFLGVTLQLDNYAKAKIQEKVNSLNRSSTHYQVFLDRCNLYFPIIDAILEKEGVPKDFKYVALHESTLKGDAVSRTGAIGYWQFKDFTAEELGMKINNKIDERSNVVVSTFGAAKYLKKNYSYLGHWFTTLISHNKGLGGTQRTIGNKYNGKKVIKLNRSTPAYVFYCLANKIAFEDAISSRNSKKLYIHNAKPGDKLSDIAAYTNVNLNTLKLYNKWLKKDALPNDRTTYKVLIPIATQEEKFVAKALSNSKKNSSTASNKSNTVRKTDQITTIEENSVSTVNSKYPLITKKKKVTIGSYSLRMVSANGVPAFIAERGQSPAKVAEFLDMSPKRLMKLNDLKLFDKLEAGKVYYIKQKKTKAEIKTHTVKAGETVWDIAHTYGITVDALRDKNRLGKKEGVKQGRVLLLRKKLGKNEKPKYERVVSQKRKVVSKNSTSNKKIPKEKVQKPKKVNPPKKTIEKKSQPDKKIVEKRKEPVNSGERTFPSNAKVYVLKQNETVMTVIQKHGLTIRQFKTWNPMDDYLSIPKGTPLMVGYETGKSNNPTFKRENTQKNNIKTEVKKMKVKPASPKKIYHTVQRGDTLYSLSKKYQVSIQQIQKNNNKTNNSLSVGEKLLIK